MLFNSIPENELVNFIQIVHSLHRYYVRIYHIFKSRIFLLYHVQVSLYSADRFIDRSIISVLFSISQYMCVSISNIMRLCYRI